jgi:enoyl-CoA hydratase/carnithine racemase
MGVSTKELIEESRMNPKTLNVAFDLSIATIELNRPEKANAMEEAMWRELREVMRWADETPEVRVVILCGAGRHFTAGIDLAMLQDVARQVADPCSARSREELRRVILDLQDSLTSIERCRKPVIAAIHGACVGAGIDLITACDLRYCSAEAKFSVKEIDVGMTADVGTLQRLPRLIGEGIARELAYTGRMVDGAEARDMRLVNRCFDSPEALREGVQDIARAIAAKSPLAVRGCKEMITYARDHSIADGLNYVATWNAAMLLSDDLTEAAKANAETRTPVFRD